MRSNFWWKNLACSLLRSHVIPALLSFFRVQTHFFEFGSVFGCRAAVRKKKPIRYSESSFYPEHFEKKIFLKISENKKACQTLKIFDQAISSHLISFRFLLFSGHFRTVPEHQKSLRGSRKIWWRRRKKNQGDISRGTYFIVNQKKILISLYILGRY